MRALQCARQVEAVAQHVRQEVRAQDHLVHRAHRRRQRLVRGVCGHRVEIGVRLRHDHRRQRLRRPLAERGECLLVGLGDALRGPVAVVVRPPCRDLGHQRVGLCQMCGDLPHRPGQPRYRGAGVGGAAQQFRDLLGRGAYRLGQPLGQHATHLLPCRSLHCATVLVSGHPPICRPCLLPAGTEEQFARPPGKSSTPVIRTPLRSTACAPM